MIITKQNLLDRRIKFNVDIFLKSRLTPRVYFNYFYKEVPRKREYNLLITQ